VVLGALGAVIIHAARLLGLILQGTIPWLSFPAPLPWFLGILIAPLLTQRVGSALLTSLVTAVIGFGGLALCAGIVVELTFLAARTLRGRNQTWPPPRSPRWLVWTIVAAVLVSLMSFGFMFLYQEFLLLDADIKLLALAMRVALGVAYAWLAWAIANGLLRAGVDPARVART
jgi:cation transporter-like permease